MVDLVLNNYLFQILILPSYFNSKTSKPFKTIGIRFLVFAIVLWKRVNAFDNVIVRSYSPQPDVHV